MPKLLKLFIFIACLPIMAADAAKPCLQLGDFERDFDTTYVYLGDECKKALLQLNAESQGSMSQGFAALCQAIRARQLVTTYDAAKQAIKEGLNFIARQKVAQLKDAAAKLQEYDASLKSGEALVEFEDEDFDATRGSCCKSSKAFCRLFVRDQLQVCGNLVVNGMTTLNSLVVQNNITVQNGTVDAPGGVFGAPVLIPFSSGRFTLEGGTTTIPDSVTNPPTRIVYNQDNLIEVFDGSGIAPILPLVAIGFGNSNSFFSNSIFNFNGGACAFDIPEDGLLFDLQASVDAHFSSVADEAKVFNFQFYLSECPTGSFDMPSGYVPMDLSISVTINGTNVGDAGGCVSACNNNLGSLCVHKGDRVVLITSMTDTNGMGTDISTLDRLALNAGVFYTRTSSTCPRSKIDAPLCPSDG